MELRVCHIPAEVIVYPFDEGRVLRNRREVGGGETYAAWPGLRGDGNAIALDQVFKTLAARIAIRLHAEGKQRLGVGVNKNIVQIHLGRSEDDRRDLAQRLAL